MKNKRTEAGLKKRASTIQKANQEEGVVETQMAGMPWKYALSGMGAVGILGAISMFRAKRNKQALDIVKGDDVRLDL